MSVIYPRVMTLFRKAINFSNTGDNAVIAADATRRIVVHRIWLVVGSDTNLTFKDNLPSPAAVPMAANGALVLDSTDEPWFITDPATAFTISQSGTAQVSGCAFYTLSL